jgi:hypothetical protein
MVDENSLLGRKIDCIYNSEFIPAIIKIKVDGVCKNEKNAL